jgi:hypothetical protein
MALDEGSLDPFKLLESMRNQRANLVDNAVKQIYATYLKIAYLCLKFLKPNDFNFNLTLIHMNNAAIIDMEQLPYSIYADKMLFIF